MNETFTGRVLEVKDYPKNVQYKMDDGNFYSAFKDKVKVQVNPGDVIEFDYVVNGRFRNITPFSVKPSTAQAANTPPAAQSSAPAAYSAPKGPDTRQLSIHYQSSRNAAIALVGAALQAGAVALPAKKGDQLDALLALTEDVTNRFFLTLEEVIEAGGVTPNIPNPEGEE